MTDIAGRRGVLAPPLDGRGASISSPDATSVTRSPPQSERPERFRPPVYSFQPVETSLFAVLAKREAGKKITTLVAPPGYGKTVVLSQLYHHFRRAGLGCLWLGLQEGDNGLGSVLTLLEHALDLSAKTRPFAASLQPTDSFDRIEAVRKQLSDQKAPLAVFIDNIDVCKDPAVDQLVDALVFDTPETVTLYVSSASTPVPFNAGRARCEGILRAVGATELSFDQDSTAALFAQAGLSIADPGALDTIVEKTEGWPAAVRLLQLIVDNENSFDRGIALLSGSDIHIADILSRRLMASLEPDLARFLYEIGEFRRFSAAFAEEVTGEERAPMWVDFLVEHNFLVIPLDEKRQWYRFHTLLSEFLTKEARRYVTASRRSEVHGKAIAWLSQRGDYLGALDLALNAKELTTAALLLEQVACLLVRDQGDTTAFIGWLKRAEDAGVSKGPQATFWYVWALIFERRFEAARKEARRAAAALESAEPASFSADFKTKLGIVDVIVAVQLDTTSGILNEAASWLATYPHEDAFDVAVAATSVALARLARFEFAEARSSLLMANATIARSTAVYGRCWVEVATAILEISQGNPLMVEERLLAMEAEARREIAPFASIAAIIALVRAAALCDLGRHGEAGILVAANLERAAHNEIPDTAWLGIEAALACAVAGAPQFTDSDLRRIARDYTKRVSILTEFKLIQRDLLLGRLEDAFDLARNLGWDARVGWPAVLLEDVSPMVMAAAAFTSASLLMASGHHPAAANLAQEELRRAQETGRRKAQVEWLLLNAEIQMHANARPAALRFLSRAIATAAKRNLFGAFVERRAFLAHVLENGRVKELGLTNREELAAYGEILRRLGVQPSAHESDDQFEDFADPLTPREIELLHLLESGLDNAQLADRLAVTVRTIKWHLSNLYAKLDVKNRSSAVAKARTLRLLRH